MSKVVLSGHIVVPESDLAAVLAELPTHIELTRQETGCLMFEVTQDPDDEHKFHVYEEFTDPSAFRHHQARVGASEWGRVATNVARHYQVEGLND